MYKYKQTTDVEVGDLVVWTDISKYHGTLTKDKVYQVTNHPDQNTLNVINDKGNKNSYGKGFGFKVLQTKPASEAVVGDYMYRISSGTERFPQHSVIKITKIDAKSLWYASTKNVYHNEVIVIAQAEPQFTYPLFMQSTNHKSTLIKFIDSTKGTCMLNGIHEVGHYSSAWANHQDKCWKPCDFTIQPDIDDIDWWQQRFEAGLPVYVIGKYGYTNRCMSIPPKNWDKNYTFSITDPSLIQKVPMSKEDIELFKQQVPLSTLHLGLCNEIPLGATTDCSLQPIIKEQPMDKTTLKLLLELLGASEEVKDATNSKFVGIITNEDEYVGYMYFDSKEDATECMAQPKMELHKLHLFEKSCVLAQKPRKVIEV